MSHARLAGKTPSCQAKPTKKGQEKVKDQSAVLMRLAWISKGRFVKLSHALQAPV